MAASRADAQAAAERLPSPPAHLARQTRQPGSVKARSGIVWLGASHHSGTAQHPANPEVRSFNRYQVATKQAAQGAHATTAVLAAAITRQKVIAGKRDDQRGEIGRWNPATQPADNVIA